MKEEGRGSSFLLRKHLSGESVQITNRITVSCVLFLFTLKVLSLNFCFFESKYKCPAQCGAPLDCGWDTVAAPVADVNGKRRHAISRPIGHSPLRAIIEWRCAWKRMIMRTLSSWQQLIINVMYYGLTTEAQSTRTWVLFKHRLSINRTVPNSLLDH